MRTTKGTCAPERLAETKKTGVTVTVSTGPPKLTGEVVLLPGSEEEP